MDPEKSVNRAFPELDHIEDDDVRDGVVTAWTTAITETGVDNLERVQWQPPEQDRLDLPDETLVAHVRDVTQGAMALAECMVERRSQPVSMDTLVAGALVHDVSKLYDYDHETAEHTPIGELLVHPHYGLHVAAAAGLPVPVLHVLIAHSLNTGVEPATLEAEIVRRADEVAAAAIRLRALDDLRTA